MQKDGKHHYRYRVGSWETHSDEAADQYVKKNLEGGRLNFRRFNDATGQHELYNLSPEVKELEDLILNDPGIFMYFHLMFDLVTKSSHRAHMPIQNPVDMLAALNFSLTEAIEFSDQTSMVIHPVTSILNWTMETKAGFAALHDEKVNKAFKHILNAWGRFLTTPESCKYLTGDDNGWFCSKALEKMIDSPSVTFDQLFVCDSSQPHMGFNCWDDFFTRKFRDGARPVEDADDPTVINNACESAPYNVEKHVKATDAFWIKGQPYSLRHIFGNDPVYEVFIGGTIYQAYLSPFRYHRWHSPVNGTIVRFYLISGSYFAEAPYIHDEFSTGPQDSQGYIAQTATRAVILIQADNPDIGLMAFVGVGMVEVSTCDVTVTEGQRILKGEELGMFHFGGSTHVLVFRASVNLAFDYFGKGDKLGPKADVIHINKRLANVVSNQKK
jgi:phosphatidylserine decarboxylase